MTSRDRFQAIMSFECCDRSLDWENGIWLTTVNEWYKQGLPKQEGEPDSINITGRIYFSILDKYLNMDEAPKAIPIDLRPKPAFSYEVYEETDNYIVARNEWGIKMKVAKDGDTMPHFLERPVKNKADFDRLKERYQLNIKERYPDNWNELLIEYKNRTYPLSASDFPFGIFGFARELMGPEALFYAFYDEPELVKDIMNFTADYLIAVWEKALVEAKPDFFRIWEDMAYKSGPLISPELFREFMLEPYKKLTGFIKDCGCKNILVDCDGNVTKLIPLFIEGGVTGLYPFECMSGMDVVKVREAFPKLQMWGGINKRVLAASKEDIDAELEYKMSIISKGGYIPFADHFVPPDVSWDNFLHYRLKVKELLYKNPVSP